MAEELPVHPSTGLTALGVLPSGRIVWPVLGAAPEDDDQGGDDQGGDDQGGDGSDAGSDGDGLADKGKKALAAERLARREAEKARRAAEAELAALKAQAAQNGGDDAAAAAERARRDAEATANAKANARILKAEIRAAAAGKLTDPADALAHLDLTQFEVGDDGSVDAGEISDAISDLLKRKPYLAAKATGFQGTGDGGATGRSSGPKQLTRADLKTMRPEQIAKARQEGRLDRLLGAS
jgi:hypothetical protein